MEPTTRVCPYCGEPPGEGVFCAACGRNLGGIEQLPTRSEWERREAADRAQGRTCAEATAAFLDAMRASGNPGAEEIPMAKKSAFRRAGHAHGWIVRPVDRVDFGDEPRRYEPGLVLTVEGHYHVLDSEIRGWGQRDFPVYHHTVRPEPIETPDDDRLVVELDELLRRRVS